MLNQPSEPPRFRRTIGQLSQVPMPGPKPPEAPPETPTGIGLAKLNMNPKLSMNPKVTF